MKGTLEFSARIRLTLLQDRPWSEVKDYFLSKAGGNWTACIGEKNQMSSTFSIVDIESPPSPPIGVQFMVYRDNGWVGPFETSEQATAWAGTHLDPKTQWSMCVLMSPSLQAPRGK